MTGVFLNGVAESTLASASKIVASQAVSQIRPVGGSSTSTQAVYFTPFGTTVSLVLTGTGLTTDANGLLVGGTITTVDFQQFLDISGYAGLSGYPVATYSGLSLSPAALAAVTAQSVPSLLSGDTSFVLHNGTATGYGGNDTFLLQERGQLIDLVPLVYTVDGGGGVNTLTTGHARSDATVQVAQGGGAFTVQLPASTTSATHIDLLQFNDGALLLDASTPEAQASLAFLGIFGRLPDPVNAGGFGAVSRASGVAQAVSVMLATPEASAAVSGLSPAGYVTRLYQNMLQRMPTDAEMSAGTAALAGGQTEGAFAAQLAAGAEAASVNQAVFGAGGFFAADPGYVEVLRAYVGLLGVAPNDSALTYYGPAFDPGASYTGYTSLAAMYRNIQSSTQFASSAAHLALGLTAISSYADVYAALHSDAVTAATLKLVSASGGVAHSPNPVVAPSYPSFTLSLTNTGASGLFAEALAAFASQSPTSLTYSPGSTTATSATYASVGPDGITATFTGVLSPRTPGAVPNFDNNAPINALKITRPAQAGQPAAEEDIAFAFGIGPPNLVQLATVADPAAALFTANTAMTVNAPSVTGYAGDDTITILGAGTGSTTTAVSGGAGTNTMVFQRLRGDATVASTGLDGNTVSLADFTANLQQAQVVSFIDGTMANDNAGPAGQIALIYRGIVGSWADPTTLGNLVRQDYSGVTQVASVILALPQAAPAMALSNGDYVQLVYQGILGRAATGDEVSAQLARLANATSRATVVVDVAGSAEAETANAAAFASGAAFSANPNAVEVLRAYEVLLGRLPEGSSLAANTMALGTGAVLLPGLYFTIRTSAEFASRGSNAYGLTASSTYSQVYAAAHSDTATAMIMPYVTQTGVTHLAG